MYLTESSPLLFVGLGDEKLGLSKGIRGIYHSLRRRQKNCKRGKKAANKTEFLHEIGTEPRFFTATNAKRIIQVFPRYRLFVPGGSNTFELAGKEAEESKLSSGTKVFSSSSWM